MGRPKKVREEGDPSEIVSSEPEEEVIEESSAPSELDVLSSRQADLLSLRAILESQKIDSISKLDVLLGQVNERIRQLQK